MDGFCVGFGSGAQSAFQPVGLVSSLQRSSARHGSQSPRPSSWVGFRSFIRPLFTHSLKLYPVICMKWIEHVLLFCYSQSISDISQPRDIPENYMA